MGREIVQAARVQRVRISRVIVLFHVTGPKPRWLLGFKLLDDRSALLCNRLITFESCHDQDASCLICVCHCVAHQCKNFHSDLRLVVDVESIVNPRTLVKCFLNVL